LMKSAIVNLTNKGTKRTSRSEFNQTVRSSHSLRCEMEMSPCTPHFHPDAKYLFHSAFLFVRIGKGLFGVAALLSRSIFTRLPEGSDSGSPVILPSPPRIYPNGAQIKMLILRRFEVVSLLCSSRVHQASGFHPGRSGGQKKDPVVRCLGP